MKKILALLIPLLLVASIATASWVGDFLNAGIDPTNDDVTVTQSLVLPSTTVTASGPTDDLDLDDVNVVFIDTSSNNVTIGGVTGTVSGQVVQFTIIDSTNNATIENAESTGNQDFYLNSAGDEATDTAYGGWTFVSNGTHLYEVNYD